jgi:hypothetical protein
MRTLCGYVIAFALVSSALGGCLEERSSNAPSCNGGDAYRLDASWYCIYTGAIIIEGFMCPESMPNQFFFDGQQMGFGAGSGQVGICSPGEDAPPGGWRDVFDKWREDGGQSNPWPADTSDIGDTVPDGVADSDSSESDALEEVGPVPGPCDQGLTAGACWETSQCPTGWSCGGQTPDCTTCQSCPGATLGECTATQDAVALVWDGSARVALWSVLSPYTLIPCPGFLIETASAAAGPWTAGPQETSCSAAVPPPSASPLTRPAPTVDAGLWTRVRGTLLTECFSADPGECSGSMELVSEPLAPLP